MLYQFNLEVHIPTRPDIFHCFHCPDIETSLNEWHIRMQLNSTHPHSYVQLSIFLIGYLAQIALPSPYSRQCYLSGGGGVFVHNLMDFKIIYKYTSNQHFQWNLLPLIYLKFYLFGVTCTSVVVNSPL